MQKSDRGFAGVKKEFKKNGILYLIVLPVIIYYFVFHYRLIDIDLLPVLQVQLKNYH